VICFCSFHSRNADSREGRKAAGSEKKMLPVACIYEKQTGVFSQNLSKILRRSQREPNGPHMASREGLYHLFNSLSLSRLVENHGFALLEMRFADAFFTHSTYQSSR